LREQESEVDDQEVVAGSEEQDRLEAKPPARRSKQVTNAAIFDLELKPEGTP